MKQPKYFYLTTQLGVGTYIEGGNLKRGFTNYIGGQWWPHTREEARAVGPQLNPEKGRVEIFQFENKPPYKFIKKVS